MLLAHLWLFRLGYASVLLRKNFEFSPGIPLSARDTFIFREVTRILGIRFLSLTGMIGDIAGAVTFDVRI